MKLQIITRNPANEPSEANKAALEQKYGKPWHRCSEARAFVCARLKCQDPRFDDYDITGARGIKFLYTSLDQFLADVGFKPGKNFGLDRIDMAKNFEPGNCQWSPMSVISQKHGRPKVERTVETMMARIIRTLKRQPNMEMSRPRLQHSSGSVQWGAPIFHDAVQQLIDLGFITFGVEERTFQEADGNHPGLTRPVTRRVAIVRLKQGNGNGSTTNAV